MTLLGKAIGIAEEAHYGQKRANGQAYVLHSLSVMNRVRAGGEEAMMVGVLHDVKEDAPEFWDKIVSAGFPGGVTNAVLALTRHENESYEMFVHRANQNGLAKKVKEADIMDNLGIDGDIWFDPNDEVRHAKRIVKYVRALAYLRGKLTYDEYMANKLKISAFKVG